MTTQHANSQPSPEEERMVLDAFYGRVARIVVIVLLMMGAFWVVPCVIAPAAYNALGGSVAVLLLLKLVGALVLFGLAFLVLARAVGGNRRGLLFGFAIFAPVCFQMVLSRETRAAGLGWLDWTAQPLGVIAILVIAIRSRRSGTPPSAELKNP
jgi:hypothetical protein